MILIKGINFHLIILRHVLTDLIILIIKHLHSAIIISIINISIIISIITMNSKIYSHINSTFFNISTRHKFHYEIITPEKYSYTTSQISNLPSNYPKTNCSRLR